MSNYQRVVSPMLFQIETTTEIVLIPHLVISRSLVILASISPFYSEV